MFAAIIATGVCGAFALSRSQATSALLGRTFEQATGASLLSDAVDREYAELLAPAPLDGDRPSAAFVGASNAFATGLDRLRREGGVQDAPALRSVASAHRAFLAAARTFRSAIAHGDGMRATRIAARNVLPNVARIRVGLHLISAETARAARR